MQNFVEYLHEKHPDWRAGVVSKVQYNDATPGAFLGHSASRYNYSDMILSVADYAKADLFLSGGYDEFFEQYQDNFEKKGWNTVSVDDYEKDNDILNKTDLPLAAALSHGGNLLNAIDCSDSSFKLEPNLATLTK